MNIPGLNETEVYDAQNDDDEYDGVPLGVEAAFMNNIDPDYPLPSFTDGNGNRVEP